MSYDIKADAHIDFFILWVLWDLNASFLIMSWFYLFIFHISNDIPFLISI